MSDDRMWDLWTRWNADGDLSDDEQGELLEMMRGNEDLRTKLMEDRRMEGMLRGRARASQDAEGFRKEFRRRLETQGDTTRFIRKIESQLPKEKISTPGGTPPRAGGPTPPAKQDRPPSTRRVAHRSRFQAQGSNWFWALAAAGLLFAVFVLVTVSLPGPDPKLAQKTPLRGSMAREQAERDRLERERAAEAEIKRQEAEAQAKRLEAEAHLREIKEKRRVLTQAKPEAAEDPKTTEKREKDLEALKRDQERIEQDLREAAELAKRAERPAPAALPQGEKPQPGPAAPADPSTGATQVVFAKVEELSGVAFAVTKEGKTPVSAGANLLPGQGLETGKGPSRIVLRFPDTTRVDLGPDTMMAEIKTDSGKRVTLTQGSVRAVVAKQPKDQPLVFFTPQGSAKVVGTTLRLAVDPDPKKGTRLEVEEGKVELKNLAGKAVFVESGHYAVAAVGVELVARVLPPRPRPAAFIYRNPRQSWGAILQTVTLVPGQTYTLSVWIQTSTPDPANSIGQFPGGSIGVRTETGSILAQQPFGPSEAYARTVVVFKAGPNPTAVIFAGLANATDGNTWIHLDDWSLAQKGGEGTNLVQDPDYEGQNPAGGPLAGPWFTEGPATDLGGKQAMGVTGDEGRIPAKGNPQGERK